MRLAAVLTTKSALFAARFLQRPLAKLISTLRAPKILARATKLLGAARPLRRITEEQAAALAQSLKRRGLDAKRVCGHALLDALH